MADQRALTISSGDEAERPSRKIAWLLEETVLYPYSKTLHQDDWPCFVLSSAVVYGKDGKTPASLIHAELEGPMVIRGRLEVDKEFRHLRKITSPRCPEVLVKDVKCFSISTGPVTIWAMGQAGWFEIRPSVTYQSVYKKMVEGVSLYYFLVDFYEARKTLTSDKSLHMDQIFKQYSKKFDKSLTTIEVASRCEEHAIFLLSQMRKSGGSTPWSRTVFYHWLIERCPEIHDRYEGKTNEKDSRARKSTSVIELAPVVKPEPNNALSKIPDINFDLPLEDSPRRIVEAMNNFHDSGQLPRRKMNLTQLSEAIYERFDIDTEKFAREILLAYAIPITSHLEPKWFNSPIYKELKEVSGKSERGRASIRRQARMLVIRPRSTRAKGTEQSTEQHVNHAIRTMPILGRRRKRSSESGDNSSSNTKRELERRISATKNKFVDKGKGKEIIMEAPPLIPTPSDANASRARLSFEDVITSSGLEGPRRGAPRLSGKVAKLRLAGTNTSRAQMITASDEEDAEPGPSRKRPKLSASPANDDSELTQSSNETASDHDTGPLRSEEDLSTNYVLTLISEPLPSSSPNRPNGLWDCEKRGCDFYVVAADTPDGRAKTQAHLLQHADEIAAKENLVREESRPYLSINHLLEKLRSMGEAARVADEQRIGGRVVPQPIKRRLAV